MPSDELPQLLDDVVVTAEGEIRLDPLLQRRRGAAPRAGRSPPGRTSRRRTRRAAGRARGRDPRAASSRPLSGSPAARLSRPVSSKSPKAVEVELAGLDAKHVAVVAGQQDPVAGAVQRLAQPRDVHLDDLRGARRLLVRPELVDQPVARHDLVRVDEEQGEDTALLAAAHVEHAVLVETSSEPRIRKSMSSRTFSRSRRARDRR